MATDVFATQGAMASAAMVLTQLSLDIAASTTEVLIYQCDIYESFS